MQQPRLWKQALCANVARFEYALRGASFSATSDLPQIHNFLFLQYDTPLGSAVHATPLFEALKQAIPGAHITVAASPMAASVLGNNPFLDRCSVIPNPFTSPVKAAWETMQLARSMPPGPRCIITTIGNQRTRLAMLAIVAGKAVRVGYTLASGLYDLALDFHPARGQIEGNLDILRSLGHDVVFHEPRVFFTQDDADAATRMLYEGNCNSASLRIAFVTQNSGGQPNRWRKECFAQVTSALSRNRHAVPVFLGTPGDAAAIESLRRSLPIDIDQGISLAGKTTVPQLAAVLAQCDLAVSLDTGTFHVARAVGLPGVVIAPAWQSALEWLPVDHARYRVLQGPRIAKPESAYFIEEITVRQVIEAAEDLLARFPISGQARRQRLENSLALPALRQ